MYQGTCGFANNGAGKGPHGRTTSITRWVPQRRRRELGLLRVQRPRLLRRSRAPAGAGLPARTVHQAVRRVRAVADECRRHLLHRQPDHHADLEQSRDEGLVGLGALHPTRCSSNRSRFSTATVPFLSVSRSTASTALATPPQQGSTTTLPTFVPALPTLSLIQPEGVAQPRSAPYLPLPGEQVLLHRGLDLLLPAHRGPMDPGSSLAVQPRAGRGRARRRRLVQDVRVLRGPQPDDRRDRAGRPGDQLRLGPAGCKPGLMNLNLIVDEEAFFSIFGSQNASQGYNQTLLNSIELPLLSVRMRMASLGCPIPCPWPRVTTMPRRSRGRPAGAPGRQRDPAQRRAQLRLPGDRPDPVYPARLHRRRPDRPGDQRRGERWYPAQPYPVGNRIKAAFAQFLWSRHGGSGYLFGHGGGSAGRIAPSSRRS